MSRVEEVRGYVVGNDRDSGTGHRIWKVRVNQVGHPREGEKFIVKTTVPGTRLRKALEVTFIIAGNSARQVQSHYSRDKQESGEEATPKKDMEPAINIVATRLKGEHCILWFTGAESIEEARNLIGGESEDAIAFVSVGPSDLQAIYGIDRNSYELTSGFNLLAAITGLEENGREALEALLTLVFRLGQQMNLQRTE